MSFFNSLDISGSGLTATRLRMDTISENIANVETTRTEEGGPYRRKVVVYEAVDGNSFKNQLYKKMGIGNGGETSGVRVAEIAEDQSDFNMVYDPTSPDANEEGYVAKPNVDTTQEVIDMMAASRAYQMNANSLDSIKEMATRALEIGR